MLRDQLRLSCCDTFLTQGALCAFCIPRASQGDPPLRPNQNRAEINGRSRTKGAHDSGHAKPRLPDEARFIRAWLDDPLTTGAVTPSGRFLARMMARQVDPAQDGLVVELGPGTGPVTQALIRRGIAPERLVLVEFDPAFCRLLERRFPRATVIQGDALRLRETLVGKINAPVAAIVSSLPLLNMQDEQRLGLLSEAFGLMSPQGRFVQFTYGLASPMPRKPKTCRPVPFSSEVSAPVWLNLPPARVWVYRAAEVHADKKPNAAEILFGRLKARTKKVKLDLARTRAKVEQGIRLHKAKGRS